MTEPHPTWSAADAADDQKRLLAAYRLVYRANQCGCHGYLGGVLEDALTAIRHEMTDRTRLLASQWERALWKKEADNAR